MENILAVCLNKSYKEGITTLHLYEITRRAWRVNIKRVQKIEYVLGVYKGDIKSVYRVKEWKICEENNKRKYFIGEPIEEELKTKLEEKYNNGNKIKFTGCPVKYL